MISDALIGRKRTATTALLNTKAFPGIGRYQPIGFLSFLLLGPPAGPKCWNKFALFPQSTDGSSSRRRLSSSTSRKSRGGSLNGSSHQLVMGDGTMQVSHLDPARELDETLRAFAAETAARAQRLEELKAALAIFPDDENLKAEFKHFIDSSRKTVLPADILLDYESTHAHMQ